MYTQKEYKRMHAAFKILQRVINGYKAVNKCKKCSCLNCFILQARAGGTLFMLGLCFLGHNSGSAIHVRF